MRSLGTREGTGKARAPARVALLGFAALLGAGVAACAGRDAPEAVAARADGADAPGAPPAAVADTPATRVTFPDGWPFPADAAPAVGRHGMVASTDSLATAAGLEALRAGGNAMDAAVAVHFALAVVHPQAGNLGGGGFVVTRLADGTRAALDFREKAPRRATRDMFVDESGEVSRASWTGHLAAGVPASPAGLEEAHRRFGSLPWERLLEPSIRYARDGFVVREELHASISRQRDRLARYPASAAAFLPGGEPPPVGTVLRQPDLARTLRAIADSGARVFYRGWIADSVAAEMRRGGGLVDRDDMAAYEAVWRDPIVLRYRGREIVSMPPPSSGGVVLGEMLNILSGFDLRGAGWRTVEEIHLLVETMRRAYADRNHWLGDPDYAEVPVARLLSAAHADSLRATIDRDRATPSARVVPVADGSPETTHFSVVDGEGNAVAVTTTINGSFGAAVVVRGAGFLLNNEMDDFTAKPGVPNAYGLVQGEANAIEPGKRMLSSMTPTIVVAPDGRAELVTGTPGGATIITTVLQMVVNHLDHGIPAQTSVNAPRVHHQHLPDRIYYERGGLPEAVVEELRRRGHEVVERSGWSGDVHSIYVAPDGSLRGAADPRLGGKAIGY